MIQKIFAHFKIPFRGTTPIISSPAAGHTRSNVNVPKVGVLFFWRTTVRWITPICLSNVSSIGYATNIHSQHTYNIFIQGCKGSLWCHNHRPLGILDIDFRSLVYFPSTCNWLPLLKLGLNGLCATRPPLLWLHA